MPLVGGFHHQFVRGVNGSQQSDGGWGEDATSYRLDYRGHEAAPSTASQAATSEGAPADLGSNAGK
jgi:Squalene-hopene cyclase C-terminal domain